MILKYYGHAFVTLALESGVVIACDPYGLFFEYPERSVKADVCLISHHHHDHDGVSSLQPGARVIDQSGVHKLADGVAVHGVDTWHDEAQGAKRGGNLFYIVEAEGLRIGHAGDLGHVPNAGQLRQIGKLDVLMLPVGGYYTIDAQTALEVCRVLQPEVVIPIHYRTQYDAEMPIGTLGDFLSLTGAEDSQLPLLRISREDLSERPQIVTLAIQG